MRKTNLSVILSLVLIFSCFSRIFAIEAPQADREAGTVRYWKTFWSCHSEEEVILDGDDSEWQFLNSLKISPLYLFDLRSTIPLAFVRSQWNRDALYLLIQVYDKEIQVADPRSFWIVDCVELFIDGFGSYASGYNPACAHLWLVPEKGNLDGLYVGQWKVEGDGIRETLYEDIPGITGRMKRNDAGYLMEIQILPKAIGNPVFDAGHQLGFNITVRDQESAYAYWSADKTLPDTTHLRPDTWGRLILGIVDESWEDNDPLPMIILDETVGEGTSNAEENE